MYAPVVAAVSATVPFFATYLADDRRQVPEDLLVVAYVSAVGLLLSLAAILDDRMDLTSWFGLSYGPTDIPLF